MNRVVHFEIAADNPERAATFYKSVFGWQIDKWGGPRDYWMVTTGPDDHKGINGGIFKRMGPVGHVNSIDVASVDEFVTKVEFEGGKVVVPKMAIPGVGWLAYCQDTEGSIFGLHEADPSAT
ncbi:MAG: Glyoxalase [Planctomycetota bacterium]|nr:Glyoxalase [Planctomycetota bacterium]